MNRTEVETIIASIREHLDELESQLDLESASPGSRAPQPGGYYPPVLDFDSRLIATDCQECARLDGEPHHPACSKRSDDGKFRTGLSNFRTEHLLPTGLVTHPAGETCSACDSERVGA